MEGDVYENKELNERADSLTNYKEAIVKKYETIIRSQKKSTFKVVLSIFKVALSENFLESFKKLGVNKSKFSLNFLKFT